MLIFLFYFLKKLILLFSKDAFNWSKVTVTCFIYLIMIQKNLINTVLMFY